MPKAYSRGLTMSEEQWKRVEANSKLLGYNQNQFMSAAIMAVCDMIETTDNRKLPNLVLMADAARINEEYPVFIPASAAIKSPSPKSKNK